jgi:hypothetical protein
VEIDEWLLLKRKYNRGRMVGVQQWFFGGYCVEEKKGFLIPVVSMNAGRWLG